MAHEKACPMCNKQFWGNINKVFCQDSCRKRAKRKGLSFAATPYHYAAKTVDLAPNNTGLSGKGRTSKGGGVWDYAAKRVIDIGVDYIKTNNKNSKEVSNYTPISVNSLAMNEVLSTLDSKNKLYPLTEKFSQFLGVLYPVFKMLVWGKPGGGKSTFGLMLANEFARFGKVLYVSAEESPKGKTFQSKVSRVISPEGKHNIDVASKMPTTAEWKKILYDEQGKLKYKFVIYDSIQILKMSPFFIKDMNLAIGNTDFTDQINHIYISYSNKEGTEYSGQSAWKHEVDITIKCENGQAIIDTKNRFMTDTKGKSGEQFEIYKNSI